MRQRLDIDATTRPAFPRWARLQEDRARQRFVILAPETPGLRTSARNHLAGVVTAVEPGAVNSEVTLALDQGKTLTATITRGSAEALDFAVGDRAVALIKASHIILAVE